MRAPLGLRPPALGRGLRLGLVAAGAVTSGVAATTAVPRVRARDGRARPARRRGSGCWCASRSAPCGARRRRSVRRSAPRRGERLRAAVGRLVQAAAFGLSHVADARRHRRARAGHRAGDRRCRVGVRLAVRTIRQPGRADARAPGGQRSRRGGRAGRAATGRAVSRASDVARRPLEQVRVGVGVVDPEADDPARRDPDDRGVEFVTGRRRRRWGISACSAVPRISRQRTRHGSRRRDVVDDEGHRVDCCAMLRNFWLFDI